MVLVRHKLELVLRKMVHMEQVRHMLELELRKMVLVLRKLELEQHIRKELRNRRMMASCFAVCQTASSEAHRCRCHIRCCNRHSNPWHVLRKLEQQLRNRMMVQVLRMKVHKVRHS